jgi:FAD/FMN-containing dehydrogenase
VTTGITVATNKNSNTTLDQETIEALRAELRGTLLLAADAGYEQARQVWNGMIDRRPGMIVRCAGVADVIAAVKLAKAHDLVVAVKGGGHNVAGNAVCEGGLMIDLSNMRGVYVDPQGRTARAQGGATWGDFDAETQVFGLATTGGLISTTGVAGLTLGGGIGWLMGSYGLACDNLLSLDVVTADGERITASAEHNSELFWGLKGGGGNFGVVTSFEFRLFPVAPLFAGMLLHPLGGAGEALGHFHDFIRNAPDQVGAAAGFLTAPDGNPVLALVLVFNGPVEEGARVFQPLREFGSPVLDTLAATPYRVVQTMLDAGSPPGSRNYWKSSFLGALPDDAIEILVERMGKAPSPGCKLFVECFGGEVMRIGRDATAFDHRQSPFNLLILGGWELAAEDAENIAWARDTWQQMQPYATQSVYVNYLNDAADEGSDRIESAYGAEKFARLAALKAKYDPGNLFRMNQNVRPSG